MIKSMEDLQVLYPEGPWCLIDSNGTPTEYEGAVYRADQVCELVDRLSKFVATDKSFGDAEREHYLESLEQPPISAETIERHRL